MSGHSMAMTFTGRPDVTILFKEIQVNSPLALIVACFLFVLFSMAYEGLKYFKINMAQKSGWRNKKTTPFTVAHGIQTLLHLINFLFANMLMLTVMTFNTWLLVAIVLGSTIGYQICTFLSHGHKPTAKSSCHSPATENGMIRSDHKCHENGKSSPVKMPGCHVAAVTAFMETKEYHGTAAPYDNGCAFPVNGEVKAEKHISSCCDDNVYNWDGGARPIPGFDKDGDDLKANGIKLKNGSAYNERATTEEQMPLTSAM